jgi:hypothetical protein
LRTIFFTPTPALAPKNQGDRFLNETMKWISLQKPVPLILVFKYEGKDTRSALSLATAETQELIPEHPNFQREK